MNDEHGAEWFAWQRRFIHEQHLGYMAQSSDTDFTTGQSRGRQSTAALRNLTEQAGFDAACAFMPGQVEAPARVPTGGGLSIVRSDSEDRQEGCAELFRFLAEPQNSAQWHRDTGYVPIVEAAKDTKIAKSLVVQEILDENHDDLQEVIG